MTPELMGPCVMFCHDPEKQYVRNGKVMLCLRCSLEDAQTRPDFYKIKTILDRMEEHYHNAAGQACKLLGHVRIEGSRDACMDDVQTYHDMLVNVTDLVEKAFPRRENEKSVQ